VHVQCLSIASTSARSRCYHDQLIFGDKVADAALFACRLVARVGLNVEFERCHERQEEGEADDYWRRLDVLRCAVQCLGHEGWWSEGVGMVPRGGAVLGLAA
jgi:hypothetical protein